LQFFLDSTDVYFNADLLGALKEINPEIYEVTDLWMNDEVIFQISSNEGSFSLSRDVWDFAFIMADNNQALIKLIAGILECSELFESGEVDLNNYKETKE
jgi:hypothetical protein